MQKTILTLVFVVAFVTLGASTASAKELLSSERSVAVSKKALLAKIKAKSLEAMCNDDACGRELQLLLDLNAFYEQACAPNYLGSCEPQLANAVISAGNAYESCLISPYIAKNIDRTIDRNKRESPQVVTSKLRANF